MLNFARNILIPDNLKIERYRRVPDLGPRILFFSGGNALRDLSFQLTNYTYNSIHIITAFDSGGSSAKLRDAFSMIGIGDIRNRIMALADQTVKGNPDIYKLFSYRLPDNTPQKNRHILSELCDGSHPLVRIISNPMKKIICNHLKYFAENMPEGFDLNGASIGNLILTGGFLNNNRHLDTVIYIFSKLVETKGIVRPVIDEHLHLVTELNDGTILKGQHLLTGKESNPISSQVKKIFLSYDLDNPVSADCCISEETEKLINRAELICYPYGSFYSSVLVNFLPDGVASSIISNKCPKIYIPNPGTDPEQYGLNLYSSVEVLIKHLKMKHSALNNRLFLNFVLVDTAVAESNIETIKKIENDFDVQVITEKIISEQDPNIYDSQSIIKVLLSLT